MQLHKIHLKRATRPREILEISGLAHTIWRECYSGMVSSDQIEYMLENIQSQSAIKKYISEGYEYFLAKRFGVSVGYVAISSNQPHGKLFLSKIFLLKEYRGKGYADDIIKQVCETGRRLNLSAIWLTVYKHNAPAISFYKKMGFEISGDVKKDIGNGYTTDDYSLEKPL